MQKITKTLINIQNTLKIIGYLFYVCAFVDVLGIFFDYQLTSYIYTPIIASLVGSLFVVGAEMVTDEKVFRYMKKNHLKPRPEGQIFHQR